MSEYRIVSREYPHSGDVRYIVERHVFDKESNGLVWNSVFSSPELEKAKEVYTERVTRSQFVEKVIEV